MKCVCMCVVYVYMSGWFICIFAYVYILYVPFLVGVCIKVHGVQMGVWRLEVDNECLLLLFTVAFGDGLSQTVS